MNKDSVLKELSNIKHPENKQSIVELGMVENLIVKEGAIVFTLTTTKPNDPFLNSLRNLSKSHLESVYGKDVAITVYTKTTKPKAPAKRKILPDVKNIIAVASGKGGVGKSTVSANLAVVLAKKGYSVGLLDADLYGPSVPKMFGVENTRPGARKVDGIDLIQPVENYGVKMLSIGFFVRPEDATIWRGAMATSTLKQLIEQAEWGELDYLLIDLPPGTGDIHLTMVQEIPVTGAVIVSTPQAVALADVVKGISMFKNPSINVPVLGLIENMAWFTPEELPNNKYYIFGKEGCKTLANEMGLPLLGQIPIVQGIREDGDNGKPSTTNDGPVAEAFSALADNMLEQLEKRLKQLPPTQKVEIKYR